MIRICKNMFNISIYSYLLICIVLLKILYAIEKFSVSTWRSSQPIRLKSFSSLQVIYVIFQRISRSITSLTSTYFHQEALDTTDFTYRSCKIFAVPSGTQYYICQPPNYSLRLTLLNFNATSYIKTVIHSDARFLSIS